MNILEEYFGPELVLLISSNRRFSTELEASGLLKKGFDGDGKVPSILKSPDLEIEFLSINTDVQSFWKEAAFAYGARIAVILTENESLVSNERPLFLEIGLILESLGIKWKLIGVLGDGMLYLEDLEVLFGKRLELIVAPDLEVLWKRLIGRLKDILLQNSSVGVEKPRLFVWHVEDADDQLNILGFLNLGGVKKGTELIDPISKTKLIVEKILLNAHSTHTALPIRRLKLIAKADPLSKKEILRKGTFLTLPVFANTTETVDVLVRSINSDKNLFEEDSLIKTSLGNLEFKARLVPGCDKNLKLAQLRFGSPLPIWVGDRLLIYDTKERALLCVGHVLNINSDRNLWKSPAYHQILVKRAKDLDSVSVYVETELLFHGIVKKEINLVCSMFSEEQILNELKRLEQEGKVVRIKDIWINIERWKKLIQKAKEWIDEYHKLHPNSAGIPVKQFQNKLQQEITIPGCFELLIEELKHDGYIIRKGAIRKSDEPFPLPPEYKEAAERIRLVLKVGGISPPSRKEIAPDRVSIQALRWLLSAGEAVALNLDVVLDGKVFREAVYKVIDYLKIHGQASAGELRELLGTSRKVIIPFLQKLDKEGITIKEGSIRKLGPKAIRWISSLETKRCL